MIYLHKTDVPEVLSPQKTTQHNSGYVWGLSFVGGICLAGDPDRMSGKSGTYWSAAHADSSYGGQILYDGFYYPNKYFALNFGLGFASYESKWSGTGQTFGNPEEMTYRGYNIIPRLGLSNLWGNVFLTAGFVAAPTISYTTKYSGTVKDGKHDFQDSGFPWGVYANVGYRIGGHTPIGFEFMLLDRYCYDYNGYRIIMWTWNLYVGHIF